MNRFIIVLNVAALSLISSLATAQQTTGLETGVRVRVTRTHGHPVIGAVVSDDADSLQVRSDGASAALLSTSSATIQKIEISMGRSRARGALVKGGAGLAIGAVSGAILGGLTYSEPETGNSFCVVVCSKGQAAAALGFLGGVGGLVVGAVAGMVSGQESWKTVPYRAGR